MSDYDRAVFMRVFVRLSPDMARWPDSHPTPEQFDAFLDAVLSGKIGEKEMQKILADNTLFKSNNGVPVRS